MNIFVRVMKRVKDISCIICRYDTLLHTMATYRPSHKNHHQQHRCNDKNSSQDTERLLERFPTTRLSYETTIHKNESSSLPAASGYNCFILPKGKRCIAWVTEWNRRKVVVIIDIVNASSGGPLSPVISKFHQENRWVPGSVTMYDACIDNTLAYGTVFGGVIFRLTEKTYFSIHTIYWYKGESIPTLTLSGHIRLCEQIFSEGNIRQIAYTKQNSIIFGLPVLCYSEQDAETVAQGLPYQVFAIQYRYHTHTRVVQRLYQSSSAVNSRINRQSEQFNVPVHVPVPVPVPEPKRIPYIAPTDEMLTNIQAIFIVRPNIQNDIYELFVIPSTNHTKEPIFHNFAHIPSYNTSIMMNRLFRNIAENQRLDALEESDDENDFENIEPDKYVSLHKEYMMICRFHKRFCRWVPIQVAPTGSTVSTHQQIKQHEIHYLNTRRFTHIKK